MEVGAPAEVVALVGHYPAPLCFILKIGTCAVPQPVISFLCVNLKTSCRLNGSGGVQGSVALVPQSSHCNAGRGSSFRDKTHLGRCDFELI